MSSVVSSCFALSLWVYLFAGHGLKRTGKSLLTLLISSSLTNINGLTTSKSTLDKYVFGLKVDNLPSKKRESKKVSIRSSLWCPRATLLQPSSLAVEFSTPRLKFAQS